ncbi:UvrB/UvrC motif-containing protein [Helicovermis profundi]|uniref:UvrB/UvrC motif-containing protein n=1 Tax=Helicovermis profundi TaxID=3065157 RepID=A0AAU9EPT3_9FIRM|nr:UvrB/UvrC motif-containing protein [Clostridia bacterium S502]
MKCEKCKINEATIHFNKVINDEKYDLFYCESCAKLLDEVDYDTPFSKDKMISSLMESINSSPLKVNYIVMTKCSKCGITYAKYKEIGLVGCSNCYKTFDEKFQKIISTIQKENFHLGKTPSEFSQQVDINKEIDLLKKELRKAINIEAFEEAVKIRDSIRALEDGKRHE